MPRAKNRPRAIHDTDLGATRTAHPSQIGERMRANVDLNYHVSGETAADIDNRFTYHKPQPELQQPERYERMRAMARELAYEAAALVPPGREQSLALTKLEEFSFWANAGIARGE